MQGLQRVHVHWHAGRTAIATQRPAQEDSIARSNRLPLRWDLYDENGFAPDVHELNARGDRWARSSRDHRRHFLNICSGTVAHARTADTTVVFDTYDEVRYALAGAIRETHGRLDQITIIEWRALIALELDGERLARRNQRAQRIRSHSGPPERGLEIEDDSGETR